MKTTNKQWTTAALALMLATGATALGARAQMNDDGPPPPPPPGAPQGTKPRDGNRGGERRTPQQRQAGRAQMLKRMLESAGITDEKTVDAVAALADERETATRDLQEKMRSVAKALRSGATTDKEIAATLDNLRGAVAAEKTRRAGAEKALDAEIGFSQNPRLDALLTTMGLVGDEASIIGGGGMGGRGGPGGPGGRGMRGAGGERNRGGGPDVPPPPRNDAPDDQ